MISTLQQNGAVETMDKAQATEIHKHLLAIRDAINKTEAALFKLDREDREIFGDPMNKLWGALHGHALRSVYERYPELQPIPEGFDEIDTDLRWEDVVLPPSISEADLDAVILSKLKTRSLKVARVIGDVIRAFDERGLSIGEETVGVRIRWLADVDRIKGFGDLRKWRFSEVSLKD
jgi:hypothetical protein